MNIKDTILKIRSTNIKNLNPKNINFVMLKDTLLTRLDVLINIVLIVLTFFICLWKVNTAFAKAKGLAQQIQTMEETLKAVKENETAKKSYDNFLKNFPKYISADFLIDRLSNLAGNHDVRILSISPARIRSENKVTYTTISLALEAKDLRSILLFVQDIEDSQDAVRVDNWSGAFGQINTRFSSGEDIETPINVSIDISTFKLEI